MFFYWCFIRLLIIYFSFTFLESAKSQLFFSQHSKVQVNYQENAVLIFFSNISSYKDLSFKSIYVELASGENVAAGGNEKFNGLETKHFGKRLSAAVFDAKEKGLRAFMLFIFDANFDDNIELTATVLYTQASLPELKFVKATIELEVLGGPIQCGSALPSNVNVNTLDRTKLEIILCGNPAPIVTWYISNKEAASSHVQVGKSKFQYTLYLSHVKPSMCGTGVQFVAKGYKDGAGVNGSTSLNVISQLNVDIKQAYRMNSFCVKVTWTPVDVGICTWVTYDVRYSDGIQTQARIESSSHPQGETETTFCQNAVNVIKLVEVRVVFNGVVGGWRRLAVSDHKPKEAVVTTQKQISIGTNDASDWVTWAIVGGVLGGLLLIGIVVSLILYCCSTSCALCWCACCKKKKGSDSMKSFDITDSKQSMKPNDVTMIAPPDPALVYSNSRAKQGHQSSAEQQFFDPKEFGMDSIESRNGKGSSEQLNQYTQKPSILI